MCREKVFLNLLKQDDAGSPLRVQGKVARSSVLTRLLRITPACAGKRLTEE